MNKKGFTVVEVVISFSMLAVILVALFTFVVDYRDKMKNEESRTQLYDFKNTVTKVIYDDIIEGKYKSIEYCIGIEQCVYFKDTDDNNHILKVLKVDNSNDVLKRGLYINYDDVNYFLPDSDIQDETGYMCSFDEFYLDSYNDIYSLKIPISHYGLGEKVEIMITLN